MITPSAQKRYYKNRRKKYVIKKRAGVCVFVGCSQLAEIDRSLCKKHLLFSTASILKRYYIKKRRKICVYGGCFKKAFKGRVQCITHYNIANKRNAIGAVKLKFEVFSHYCGGPPHCQCPGCDVVFIGFLQVDHIKGGGSKQRKLGISLLSWLKRNKYPKNFQILCANCNSPGGKGAKKWCPLRGKTHHA